jgi:hypothetical protein
MINEILAAIDSEISVLKQARELLTGGDHGPTARRVGQPAEKKRTMSAEGRARIGAATRARWAAGKMGKQSVNRAKKK